MKRDLVLRVVVVELFVLLFGGEVEVSAGGGLVRSEEDESYAAGENREEHPTDERKVEHKTAPFAATHYFLALTEGVADINVLLFLDYEWEEDYAVAVDVGGNHCDEG